MEENEIKNEFNENETVVESNSDEYPNLNEENNNSNEEPSLPEAETTLDSNEVREDINQNFNSEPEVTNEEINSSDETEKKSNSKSPIIILILIILIAGVLAYLYFSNRNNTTKAEVTSAVKNSAYRMTGNGLQKFDLYFLQLENEEKNKVYSPLSIKYALEMLSEGTTGESKSQIDAVIGDYVAKKYTNSKNMSFANAIFIKDSYKKSVKNTYIEKLKSKYGAEVVYDSFNNPTNINNWVKNKTLNLISDMFDDSINQKDFIIVNALGIDMEWKQMIQADIDNIDLWYNVSYLHEDFGAGVDYIEEDSGYNSIKFDNKTKNAKAVTIDAAINNYDIVKTLGENNIRKTVSAEYDKWLSEGGCGETDPDTKTFIETYMKEINSNYKRVDTSTDFLFYNDENTKAFAKDLKTYDGITLQYVGIMPKNTVLKDYISQIDEKSINTIISSLKEVKTENFKEGVITHIIGDIPLFNFNYDLDLINDLKKLNITNVFDKKKANLTNLTSDNTFIQDASHKATIEFSNYGIKAAAVTQAGGLGDIACEFEYDYEVPVEELDLTFDNPYMFLIRDKDSGEVWFAGTVYDPINYVKQGE